MPSSTAPPPSEASSGLRPPSSMFSISSPPTARRADVPLLFFVRFFASESSRRTIALSFRAAKVCRAESPRMISSSLCCASRLALASQRSFSARTERQSSSGAETGWSGKAPARSSSRTTSRKVQCFTAPPDVSPPSEPPLLIAWNCGTCSASAVPADSPAACSALCSRRLHAAFHASARRRRSPTVLFASSSFLCCIRSFGGSLCSRDGGLLVLFSFCCVCLRAHRRFTSLRHFDFIFLPP
mmetsp:Transcript_19742/g.49615  ORF Transcript_19742/g.49615 Transcript_19742/m.49615 type:complete len:242 (+) Transcript_19742:579-1304(+)